MNNLKNTQKKLQEIRSKYIPWHTWKSYLGGLINTTSDDFATGLPTDSWNYLDQYRAKNRHNPGSKFALINPNAGNRSLSNSF